MDKPTPCNACGMTLLGPCNHPRCWKRGRVSGEVAHLRAENDRLRAALSEAYERAAQICEAPLESGGDPRAEASFRSALEDELQGRADAIRAEAAKRTEGWEVMIRITAPHFVAGAQLNLAHGLDHDAYVSNCAPIIKYMEGWTFTKIRTYCDKKGWEWELLK